MLDAKVTSAPFWPPSHAAAMARAGQSLPTVGALRTSRGGYALLSVTTEEQMLQDATVKDGFWGHQGFQAWTARCGVERSARMLALTQGTPAGCAST